MRLRFLVLLPALTACGGTHSDPAAGSGGMVGMGGAIGMGGSSSGGAPVVSSGGSAGSGGCLPFQSMQNGHCSPTFGGAFLPAGIVHDMAIAPDGSFYVVGVFDKAADFDPSEGVDMQTPAGGNDGFVTHFAADGSYLWTHTIGGVGAFAGVMNVAVAQDGTLILAGSCTGPVDLDPGPGTDIESETTPHSDGFIAKWDPTGALVTSARFTGEGESGGLQFNGLALGANSEVYAVGAAIGKVDLHLPLGDGTVSVASDMFGAFALSLGSDFKTRWGFAFLQSDFLSVSASPDGSVWIGGQFEGTVDFDPSVATNNQTSAGREDGVVLHVDAEGALLSATRAGGTDYDYITSVAAAADGSVYVLGSANPSDFQVSDVTPTAPADVTDIFFARLSDKGAPIWADVLGGPGSDTPTSLLATADGVIALGSAESPNVPFDRAGSVAWTGKPNSGFITKRHPDGSHVFTIPFGGSAYFVPQHIGLSATSMVVAGLYGGTPDLDPGPETFSFPMAENTYWVARFDL